MGLGLDQLDQAHHVYTGTCCLEGAVGHKSLSTCVVYGCMPFLSYAFALLWPACLSSQSTARVLSPDSLSTEVTQLVCYWIHMEA